MPRIYPWLIAKLSRVTNSAEIIREIDGLRFIAISSVMLHHIVAGYFESTHRFEIPPAGWKAIEHPLVWLLGPTWFGVQLFFAISGFVLALPFARHHLLGTPLPTLKDYYLRRLTRIEPPYAIALCVYMAVILFTQADWLARVPHFFASLFYVHNLVYGELSRISGVLWSLEIEVQFYLLAPFLAQLFRIKPAWLRRGALIALTVFTGYFIPRWICVSSMRCSLTLLCSLNFFLAGFLLVEIYLSKLVGQPQRRYLWDGLVPITSGTLLILLLKYWQWWSLLPFLIVLLYVSLFLGRLGNRFITHPAVYTIGGMCYTLYLYHTLVIKQLGPLSFAWWSPDRPLIWDLLLQVFLLGPIIVAIGALLFIFLEKPFMRSHFRWSAATPSRAN